MAQHKWHKEIKAWADGAEIEYCSYDIWDDWNEDIGWYEGYEYQIKAHAKCITKDCTNHVNEGKFVGDLCGPCWEYITNGKGIHSQAYRNAQPKEPQYLYVYKPDHRSIIISQHKQDNSDDSLNLAPHGKCIGKIKLEVDND